MHIPEEAPSSNDKESQLGGHVVQVWNHVKAMSCWVPLDVGGRVRYSAERPSLVVQVKVNCELCPGDAVVGAGFGRQPNQTLEVIPDCEQHPGGMLCFRIHSVGMLGQ